MSNQKYEIEDNISFELKDIFECGQCFRWNKQEDGSYTGIFGKNVLNVKKENNKIIFQGNCENNIEKEVNKYFDLDKNYEEIKEMLSKIDDNMKKSVIYGNGIRILNQDLWETIISFIISANNNIPRIKKIIDRICYAYGDKIIWKDNVYYTFPTPQQLKNVTVQDFRNLGLGFRDIRLFETTHMILENRVNLEELKKENDTEKVREKLLTLSGVGPKVADCILLFSDLKRWEVFPIDVWVRRVMNELYIHNADETKVNKKEIERLAREKFGNLAGLAQQYLFYWRMNL